MRAGRSAIIFERARPPARSASGEPGARRPTLLHRPRSRCTRPPPRDRATDRCAASGRARRRCGGRAGRSTGPPGSESHWWIVPRNASLTAISAASDHSKFRTVRAKAFASTPGDFSCISWRLLASRTEETGRSSSNGIWATALPAGACPCLVALLPSNPRSCSLSCFSYLLQGLFRSPEPWQDIDEAAICRQDVMQAVPAIVLSSFRPPPKSIVIFGTGRTDSQWRIQLFQSSFEIAAFA